MMCYKNKQIINIEAIDCRRCPAKTFVQNKFVEIVAPLRRHVFKLCLIIDHIACRLFSLLAQSLQMQCSVLLQTLVPDSSKQQAHLILFKGKLINLPWCKKALSTTQKRHLSIELMGRFVSCCVSKLLLPLWCQLCKKLGCRKFIYLDDLNNKKGTPFAVALTEVLWTGGLQMVNNAGERYCSGKHDGVDSTRMLPKSYPKPLGFEKYSEQIARLKKTSKQFYGCLLNYYHNLKVKNKKQGGNACLVFWPRCEADAQKGLDYCEESQAVAKLFIGFSYYLNQTYDHLCPNQTARRLNVWAKCRPSILEYLK